jgi:protein OS-9
MSLTPPDSDYTHEYLCLMPSANTTAAQIQSEEVEEHGELDPAESWAALSHLDGRCLYSKQGWFTYS